MSHAQGTPGRGADVLAPAVCAVAVVALCTWSARGVLADPLHRIWGSGLDAYKNAWAAWWAATDRFSTFTRYVSFPDGEHGSTIAPVGNLLTAPFLALGGPALAYNASVALYLSLAIAGVVLLTHRLTGSRPAAAVAGLALLVGRPVFAQITHGTTEGFAVGWLLLACWAGLRWSDRAATGRGGLLVGGLFALAVIESPCAILVAPPLAALLAARRLRRPGWLRECALACVAGAVPAALRLGIVHDAFGPTWHGEPLSVTFLGRTWPQWDSGSGGLPWLFWPKAVAPNLSEDAFLHTCLFLGWSVLALAGLGAAACRGGRIAALVGLYAALLGVGSRPLGEGGLPGPFLFLNRALHGMGLGLTSADRVLGIASASMAVAAGCGLAALRRWLPGRARTLTLLIVAVLALEAALLGGGALSPPAASFPSLHCMRAVAQEGAVHIVVAPRSPDAPDRASNTPRQASPYIVQAALGLPSSMEGFASWAKEPRTAAVVQATDELDRAVIQGDGRIPVGTVTILMDAGFAWLVVPDTLRAQLLPPPVATCDGQRLFRLADLQEDR